MPDVLTQEVEARASVILITKPTTLLISLSNIQ